MATPLSNVITPLGRDNAPRRRRSAPCMALNPPVWPSHSGASVPRGAAPTRPAGPKTQPPLKPRTPYATNTPATQAGAKTDRTLRNVAHATPPRPRRPRAAAPPPHFSAAEIVGNGNCRPRRLGGSAVAHRGIRRPARHILWHKCNTRSED